MNLKSKFFLVSIILFFLPIQSKIEDYKGKTISKIQVYGLVNVSEIEVKENIPFKVNSVFQEEDVNFAIENLYKLGNFKNIKIYAKTLPDDTLQITIVVEELPKIKEIKIIGEEEIYEADLKTLLPIKEGDIFNQQDVKSGVEILKNKYLKEGYFLASVWYRVEEKDNEVTVIYYIDEGKNIPISKINIIGLKNLNPNDIIEVLEQKEEGIFEDGIFQESKFEEDKFRIVAYAKSKGYVNAEIDPEGTFYEIRWKNPKKPEEGRVVIVNYKLIEGEIRYFGGYSIEHDVEYINKEYNPPERKNKEKIRPVFEESALLSMLEFQPEDAGEVLDETKFFRDRNTLQQAYSSQGYVYAQIQPIYTHFPLNQETINRYRRCREITAPRNEEEKVCQYVAKSIDLEKLENLLKNDPKKEGIVLRHTHFIIRENNRAYIENIIIKGMKKTQEKVIRRELLIKEGQLFNSILVEKSRERIFNLGYFKEVNLEMRPGSDDKKMNLIISVEEQPTGTITMGGTYGTVSGFSVFTEITENNLFGTGQKISTKLQYGPTIRTISVSWTEPWFYEKCENITGRYWFLKQKTFDEAPDYRTLTLLIESFKSENLLLANSIELAIKEELQIKRWEDIPSEKVSIETLDKLKWIIRKKLSGFVLKEEECYRNIPRPWSLSLYGGFSSQRNETTALQISDDPYDLFEQASYDYDAFFVGIGVAHALSLHWSHYHRYSPTWSTFTRPTSLADTTIIQRSNLGWQFKSSLVNGLSYSSIDNYLNPTKGSVMDFSVEFVGQLLGGDDHYNRYKILLTNYQRLGDYTFGGLIRNNKLTRWAITLESRLSMTFTHETTPYNKKQNKESNPYLERSDKLYLGGYETIRGYDFLRDQQFPQPWYQFGGVNHLILGSLELRFPIEPTALWFVFFVDAGSGYLNLGELIGAEKEYIESYEENYRKLFEGKNPIEIYQIDRYDLIRNVKYFFGSRKEWNDPQRYVLSLRNLALDRFLYSVGFGLRVQIPVLPIRLYLAQKRYYKDGQLLPIPKDDKLNFVFGIGDFRF
ncbi:MAG: BamA/TamA family outer membrane protein [Leptospiraceae bacterium]|nr:BamA/TamA family outer membrane protein [Leptospiraceae bacterium]MDW7975454.1 POTRA domain-containing protein [Leptospiraceae bacterium]